MPSASVPANHNTLHNPAHISCSTETAPTLFIWPAVLSALRTLFTVAPLRFIPRVLSLKSFLYKTTEPVAIIPSNTNPVIMSSATTDHPAHLSESSTQSSTAEMNKYSSLRLTSLPDDLISMCYAELPASDLVMLESVSPRLRALIATDSVCWKRCVETRWAKISSNFPVLPAAARHAGSWKALYAEKAAADAKNKFWFVISTSETKAVVDVVAALDRATRPIQIPLHSPWHSGNSGNLVNTTSPSGEPCTPPTTSSLVASELLSANIGECGSFTSGGASSTDVKRNFGTVVSSPVSVIQEGPNVLSVVLLIDASSSVTSEDFCCMKSFATSLVTALRDAATGEPHIALIQFNDRPHVELPLTAASKPKVTATIDTMKQLTGSTDIAAPIRRARQILADEAPPGDRVIALLTDGQTHTDELRASEREAKTAADEVGARIFTLGVGRDIDESGLVRMSSATPGGMYFTLRRYIPAK